MRCCRDRRRKNAAAPALATFSFRVRARVLACRAYIFVALLPPTVSPEEKRDGDGKKFLCIPRETSCDRSTSRDLALLSRSLPGARPSRARETPFLFPLQASPSRVPSATVSLQVSVASQARNIVEAPCLLEIYRHCVICINSHVDVTRNYIRGFGDVLF